MTSTNIFQGLDGAKPSSRVLRPPGGGSSNLFGALEEDTSASRRPHKMSSTIFDQVEEPQKGPRRFNPPGGKSSGIFGEPEVTLQQQRPPHPEGSSSNNVGGAERSTLTLNALSHPNKPKDNICTSATPELEPQDSQPKESPTEVKEGNISLLHTPSKVGSPLSVSCSEPDTFSSSKALEKDHEPRLGPRPRSHNKVLNPPGGKSSVVFY